MNLLFMLNVPPGFYQVLEHGAVFSFRMPGTSSTAWDRAEEL